MESPADYKIEPGPDGPTARLTGSWTAEGVGAAAAGLARALGGERRVTLDLTKVNRLDTAGAYSMIRAAGPAYDLDRVKGRPAALRLMKLVGEASARKAVARPAPTGFHELTIRIGKGVVNVALEGLETMVFLGHLLVVLARTVVNLFTHPKRVRWAALVSTIERAGLDAIPIVALTSFFIGAVIALLGINQLRQFGAEVFSVELIGIAVLREFGIVITAVLLAGRSASAFAAEIGSMKMNQEIDAMQVLGVDPFEALVFPRFGALLIAIPLLTFVAVLSGLFGGLVVVWNVLGLGPSFFLQRIVDNVGIENFWVGLSKAPVMAAVIAGIGCRQGLEVGVDVESLGRRVTAAVVHAIFAIIMIDAAFALMYMELGV
ncbi:ABC transporter permease [Phenylobacterium sp.]|uniref:MlaE family ABC transporter permease n=1 Tax=Phenylobacterium sp. TaxID=1871053 RepID=UPI002DF4F726|nr:ABC transporter permease [Phenylobacterium sp.]